MTLHLIAEDLANHDWYERLVLDTVADVVAFAGRWAAFEEFVVAYGDGPADRDEPSR